MGYGVWCFGGGIHCVAEIGELRSVVAVGSRDEDVGGFDVAVDDAAAVQRPDTVGNVQCQLQLRLQAE